MLVKAWLVGEDFDLQSLARLFASGDTRVIRDMDGYYLVSPELHSLAQAENLYKIAAEILEGMNGIGRTLVDQFIPVELEFRFTDATHYRKFVFGSVFVRDKKKALTVHADGTSPIAPPKRGPELIRLATSDPDVRQVLGLMAQTKPLGWVEIWKTYEVVRDAVKPATLETLGWTTPAEHRAFRASANRPDISGAKARHARMGGAPPGQRMTEDDGRLFLTRIVNRWLDSLG